MRTLTLEGASQLSRNLLEDAGRATTAAAARAALLTACLAASVAGCAGPGSGIRSGVEVLATDIYRSAAWSAELPVKTVVPVVVRSVVKSYIADLEVPQDVKRRLEERVEREEFVDSTIPFIYQLSQLYSTRRATETFEQHIHAHCADLRAVPGFEHDLFHWDTAPPPTPAETPPGAAETKERLKTIVVSGIVRIFDSLFLETGAEPMRLRERRTPETIERTAAMVQDLLRNIAAQLPEDRKMKGSLAKLAEDKETIEALTISLGDLISELAYASYQRFVRLAKRRDDLREWMHEQLASDEYGRLEDYLHQAAERRYAVLICVDGLQGHLVRALAAGGGADSASAGFLKTIWQEASDCENAQPAGELKKARTQSLSFLEQMAKSGFQDDRYLPFFRSLYATAPNGIARCGISTTPTISVRNIPIVLTGATVAGPGGTGLPNFHFLDRGADRAWYFYGNDVLQLGNLTHHAGMKSIFARLPTLLSLSSSSLYDEGSLVSLDPYITVAVGEKRRDWGESLLDSQLEQRVAVEIKLRELRARLLQVLSLHRNTFVVRFVTRAAHYRRAEQLIDEIAELEDQGMPRYLQYYNPWPDHFAHPHGPFSDAILGVTGELNRLDFWLGRIDKLYRDAGIHSQTLFALAGDHGLSPVGRLLSVEQAVFAGLERDGVKLRVRKLSADEGEPPVVTHPWRPPTMHGYDVVDSSTAGGNCTLDFFVDHQTQWAHQPTVSQLQTLRTLEGKTIDILEELRKRLGEALDYLVVREGPCGVDGGVVRLIATHGGTRVDALVARQGTKIFYDFAGDVLEAGALSPFSPEPSGGARARWQELLDRARAARREDPATWLEASDWRELCSFSPRPDAVVQIAHLYDTDLAGTVNLFPAQGIAFNSLVPGRHAGESFHEKDAFVAFWGGAMRRKTPLSTAANGSLAPTVYEHLTRETISVGKDGWGFPAVKLEE